MGDEHERYQQLAVGHVLGGLDAADSVAFRSHLVGCGDCRMRVAELRDIASDLERAERDERARAAVRTEVAHEDEGPDPGGEGGPPRRPAPGVRLVGVTALVVVLLAGAMAFWNLHLRTVNVATSAVAEQQALALRTLAGGVLLDVEADPPVHGVAAADSEHVALALTGLEPPRDGERVVAWLRGPDGDEPVRAVISRHVDDGRVALAVEDPGADELVLTLERGELPASPEGRRLARVALSGGG